MAQCDRSGDLVELNHNDGRRRAIAAMAALFERWADRGLRAIDDPNVAASQFNWLIMGEPLNRAMPLGDEAIPKPALLRRHAEVGVRVFLASYGK